MGLAEQEESKLNNPVIPSMVNASNVAIPSMMTPIINGGFVSNQNSAANILVGQNNIAQNFTPNIMLPNVPFQNFIDQNEIQQNQDYSSQNGIFSRLKNEF